MIIPDLENSTRHTRSERYIKNHYPDFYLYINNKYVQLDYFPEKLYWYIHKLKERPLCPICGNVLGFHGFIAGYAKACSLSCINKLPEIKARKKESCLIKYGVENPAQLQSTLDKMKDTCLKKYGVENARKSEAIKEKAKRTCLEKYGVENPRQSKYIKEKIKRTCLEKYGVNNYSSTQECRDKVRNTNYERYGHDNYTQTQEYKERFPDILKRTKCTCQQRYGASNFTLSQQYKDNVKVFMNKSYNTKKQNNSFNTSKIEEDFAVYLDSNNITYIRQYRSEKYPFNCDFYFPERDIYLEINGTWTHGSHPFDSSNQADLDILDIWKSKNSNYYKGAIKTWTITDPYKAQAAQENGIQLYVFYGHNLEDLINFCKEKNIL